MTWNPTKELHSGLRRDKKKAHDLAKKKDRAILKLHLALFMQGELIEKHNLNKLKEILS
tara:strand:+ start:560 stop:736 length:177 start_codon:yes stop_codon:yes gene_type:complete